MLAIISVILPAAIIVIAGYVAASGCLMRQASRHCPISSTSCFCPVCCSAPWRLPALAGRCKAAGHLLRRIPVVVFAVALFLKLRKSAATPAAIVFALGAVFQHRAAWHSNHQAGVRR